MSEYSAEAAEAEQLVARATAETLVGPDWALNMAVCDLANSQALVCDDIVRLLQRRLQSGSPRATLLALVLAETVVKNGPPAVHTQVGSRAFLNEVAALTDGGMGFDVQNHALVLIKQWADAFSGSALTAFQDTYRQLKLQGIVFPDVENDAPVFTPPTSTNVAGASRPVARGDAAVSAAASAAAGGGMTRREQQIAKLQADLKVVMEKISQLRSLTSRGDGGEDLENVLDFLHQCQPRMNTLIEGGIMGKIDERTLEECLNVNDNLIKALEESRAAGRTGNLLHLDSPPTGACDIGSDFQRMSLGSRQTSSAAGSTLTSMDDDFNSFLNNRTG